MSSPQDTGRCVSGACKLWFLSLDSSSDPGRIIITFMFFHFSFFLSPAPPKHHTRLLLRLVQVASLGLNAHAKSLIRDHGFVWTRHFLNQM